ncbi:hypothetical protein L210DRAFT_3387159, partial [Boletus edulis BED1]
QTKIPAGATLCGAILSSDKTNITNMCGGRVAHPLLISLANIKMSVRNKGSSHAFLLLALMPIAKFIHPNSRMRGVLDARLFHQCLDIILEPLKQAAHIGRMMADPVGNMQYCFTPLVSYIVNTPEACMLACVRLNTSPVTTAMYKEFGDPECHPPRTAATTLNQLVTIDCDVADVAEYFAACEEFRLSGVSHPFFRDWPLARPSQFITPEGLHKWHREFWDHDIRWCMQALGVDELNFQFSILPYITSLRHFSSGITNLKQVGGRAQRDMQRFIVVVIAGVTLGPGRDERSLEKMERRFKSKRTLNGSMKSEEDVPLSSGNRLVQGFKVVQGFKRFKGSRRLGEARRSFGRVDEIQGDLS